MKNILSSLNEEQKKAVEYLEGPCMVIAGPGSGKTRVLAHKVAYLIECGFDPFRIVALTFTNKAANEMKERVIKLVGNNEARNVWMGTFHSIFARILRIEAHLLGYTSNFTIYDTDDSKNIISQILKDNNIDNKTYTPTYLLSRFSLAKTNLITPEDYNNNQEIQQYDYKAQKPLTGMLYSLYWDRCRKANAMDFDDILFNMNILIRDFKEIREKYQNRFQYILVDEYQDTCYSQYLIIKKLAEKHRNICVVGDDAQGIYSFRGAKIENIISFTRDFSDCKIFKLEQNYRSTQVIVEAANQVILNNEQKIPKKIWTSNEYGEKIKLIQALNENEEAKIIAQDIFHNKMNYHLNNSDFAILYRTNAQSRAFEDALRHLNIPYKIYGSISFYKRKEVKDIMAYFRLAINFYDEDAFLRIINLPPRGIGKTTIDKLIVYANKNKKTIWEVATKITSLCDSIGISKNIAEKIEAFCLMIQKFNVQISKFSALEVAELIIKESGYLNMLKTDPDPDNANRIENVEELINTISHFSENYQIQNNGVIPSLNDFLIEASLITSDDETSDNDNKVALMTIHSAKGLEFPYVYVAGLEENLFPSIHSQFDRADLEEERRLFYVAITRAKKRLAISFANSRTRWGKTEPAEPSRFIFEIDDELFETPRKKDFIDWTNYQDYTNKAPELRIKANNTIIFTNSNLQYPKQSDSEQPIAGIELIVEGITVYHDKFGYGVVLQTDGSGDNKKAVVDFKNHGKKNLLLKFARLKIVN